MICLHCQLPLKKSKHSVVSVWLLALWSPKDNEKGALPLILWSARSFPGPTSTKSKRPWRWLKPCAKQCKLELLFIFPFLMQALCKAFMLAYARTMISVFVGSRPIFRRYSFTRSFNSSAASLPPNSFLSKNLSRNCFQSYVSPISFKLHPEHQRLTM